MTRKNVKFVSEVAKFRNETFLEVYDLMGEKALKRAIRNLLRGDKRKIVIPEGGKRSGGGRVDTGFNAVCKSERTVTRGAEGRFSPRVVSIRNLIFFSNFAAIDPHHGLVEIPFAIRLLSLSLSLSLTRTHTCIRSTINRYHPRIRAVARIPRET